MIYRFFSVTTEEDNSRIDRWLARRWPMVGHSGIQKALRRGWIRVNKEPVVPSYKVRADQTVAITEKWFAWIHDLTPQKRASLSSAWMKKIDQWVLYKDKDFLVVNKPPGIASQGGTGQKISMDALINQWAQQQQPSSAMRLTHRLDKETSGVLLFSKTLAAAQNISAAFQQQKITKVYWALVWGTTPPKGKIALPIKKLHTTMVPHEDGLFALTIYKRKAFYTLPCGATISFVEFFPKTGRMHQLRVHAQHMGHPIIGDTLYGGHKMEEEKIFSSGYGLCLHCHAMALDYGGQTLSFQAPPSEIFQKMLHHIEKNATGKA